MARDYDAVPLYLAARETVPFGWDGADDGVQDCLRFVMDGVRAQTGRDAMAAVRGRYRNRAEAEALIAGYGSLRKLVRAGLEGVRPAFARRGDVGMVMGPDGPTLGLLDGEHVICLKGPEGEAGYTRFPREALKAAWRAD